MNRPYRFVAIFALVAMLSACATKPIVQSPTTLFADDKFLPPETPVSSADVFAVDDAMRAFLRANFVKSPTDTGARETLVESVFNKGLLRLDYDAAVTRNARDTFAVRAGNCLSLTIMAAALARELGLTVFFQRVASQQAWSRRDDLDLTIGHVNLVVGERIPTGRSRLGQNALYTIDFMRFDEKHVLRTELIGENTILAMYLNNRAVELLADGNANQSYWLAREAIIKDPQFIAPYITLGVIYRRHGNLSQAEAVLDHVLRQEPMNTNALSNLVILLVEQGRLPEAEQRRLTLARVQPYPPFHYFDLGRTAMRSGNYASARDLFARELQLSANNHEVHFWLASAYYKMGELGNAKKHLDMAVEFSPTRKGRDLYAAKLDSLRLDPAVH